MFWSRHFLVRRVWQGQSYSEHHYNTFAAVALGLGSKIKRLRLLSMSNTVDSAWSSSRFVPSIIFVLTPCIAVSLLVCWSLRMQFVRRRWYSEMARRNRLGRPAGTLMDPSDDRPPIHEVWLGRTWEDNEPNETPEYDTQENKKVESQSSLQGYVMQQYSWQTILVSFYLALPQ